MAESQLEASTEERNNTLTQKMCTDMDKEEDKLHEEHNAKN
jgi:hypothetical protein